MKNDGDGDGNGNETGYAFSLVAVDGGRGENCRLLLVQLQVEGWRFRWTAANAGAAVVDEPIDVENDVEQAMKG